MATHVIALILVAILCISGTNYSHAGAGGFTAELIHRDSPLSPTYDPSATDYGRVKAALSRTALRRNLISDSVNSVKRSEFRSRVMFYHYEYLMKIQVGTPPVTIYPILDTGSDIIWAKCLPCTNCSSKSSQIYNPEKSSSYQTLNCNSTSCDQSQTPQCKARSSSKDGSTTVEFDPCLFYVSYGDGSMTKGNMVKETIGLGSSNLHGITFGCGHDLRGEFPGSGIVGLGTGPSSLIKQMGKSIGSKFSYCLPTATRNPLSANKISFGNRAIISGPDVITTPIIPNVYYYFILKGFTGANKKWINMTDTIETTGNIIIDSGTTLTYLPKEVCENIEQSYKEAIKEKPIEVGREGLSLCYKSNVKIPSIKVHLGGGAEVVLPSTNTFIPLGQGEDRAMCLALLPAKTISIYGNLWQQNMHIGYDLDKNLLSFKHGCSKY